MIRSIGSRRVAAWLSPARACATSAPAIPPNLHVADASIFDPPKPALIPTIQFNFPLSNPPSSIAVTSFASPGVSVEDVPLNPKIFGVAIRKDIVHEVIRYHRNKTRMPYCTKRPETLRGSGKKPHAQKGIGKSQAGNKRNSAWIGGFKAHGPVLRDFSIKLNRKYKALGMMIALAAKQREGNMFVFDSFACQSHRTKEFRTTLASHGLDQSTLLMVDTALEENFALASRNLPLVEVMTQMEANVYDIVKREKLAISAAALEVLQTRLMAQYTHTGKRRAMLKGLAMMQPGAEIDLDEL